MSITLDGAALPLATADGNTLASVLETARRHCAPQRLIVGVIVNGVQHAGDALEARLTDAVSGSDRVECVTADRIELVRDALLDLADRAQALGDDVPEIATGLNGGQTAEAMTALGEFVNAWQTSWRALRQCGQVAGWDLFGADFGGLSVREHIDALSAKLRELQAALQNRDFVLVADLAHYELPVLCQTWRDLYTSLADSLGVHLPAPAL
jgi:hypothetical protein